LWLGGSETLQKKILTAFHSSAIAGHSGFPVTYQRIRRLFAWPKMKQHIKEFVQTCTICQQSKPERVKYPGLLQPLPTPQGAWQTVTMDFIEGLPTSGHANCIMVVVDKFTRYAHFIPLHHPFSAPKVAAAYVDNVFKLHGLPKVIISDRDPIFTSQFWKALFSTLGSELNMSSAYHPETDGQTERVNQCVESYLRCFAHACPRRWCQFLSLAEYWYNTSPHSALQTSPFVALYGHEPRHWGIEAATTCPITSVQDWLEERQLMQQLLQHNLNHARQLMKLQADKKRSDRTFVAGDSVFIKL
jgi:transposase InsO family protein